MSVGYRGRIVGVRANSVSMIHNMRSWLWFIAIVVASAGLFIVRIGERSVVSEEFRWAEVAREMRLSGDYFHPTINGKVYYDKPLGSYWLIVVASFLTGEVNETAARLPSAVAACLGVWLVMLLASQLYDASTGLLAGIILATSFGFAFYARRATADIETTTGVLAAVWLYARHHQDKSMRWLLGLWAVMAVTSLMKGLLGFVLPLGVFAVHSIWSAWVDEPVAGWRYSLVSCTRWLCNGWTLMAVTLAVVIYLMPFVASRDLTNHGLTQVYRENLQRFFAPRNHLGPIYLYAGVIFLLSAPWSAFLPAALAPAVRSTDGDRLARSYFWAIFVFFTLSASRRSYYLLPIVPAAGILVARLFAISRDQLRPFARQALKVGTVVVLALVVLSSLLLLPPELMLPAPYEALPTLPARWVFAALWFAAIVALTLFLRGSLSLRSLLVTTAVAMQGFIFLVALPGAEAYRSRPEFVARVGEHLGPSPPRVALCDAQELIFDLRLQPPVHEFSTTQEADRALCDRTINWLIVPQRKWPSVNPPIVIVETETIARWEHATEYCDKMMLLTIPNASASPAGEPK